MKEYYKIQTVQTHMPTMMEAEDGSWFEDSVKKLEEPLVNRVGEVELYEDACLLARHVQKEVIEDNEGRSEVAIPKVKVIKCTVFEEEVDWEKN